MITIIFKCDKCKKEVAQSGEQIVSNVNPLRRAVVDSHELGFCKDCLGRFWDWLDSGDDDA
jgi:hypothetical protein